MRYSWSLILVALIYFFQTLLFSPEVSTNSLVPRRRSSASGDLVLEILVLMDFTTTPLARSHQISFAADLAGNLSQDFSTFSADWHIYMGVVLFHDNVEYVLPLSDDLVNLQVDLRQATFGDSFLAIRNDTNTTFVRKTHRALRICNDELGLHYSAVLLFSNGTSSDLYRTHMEKRELEDKEVLIYSLALDNASDRSAERNTSLWDYTGRQYDVIGLDNETLPFGTMDGVHLPDLVQILASDLSSDIRGQASSTQSTTTSSTEEEAEDVRKINSALGGGAVVAIVLLTCCFTCSFVALAFYFWKGSRKSALVDPEPVIPTSSPSPQPVQVVLPPPPIPKDATQKALEEAINEQDLEKLHSCLSELLLQGWPDEKYADLVLKALDTVAKLRDFATASLEKSLADGYFGGSLATARLAGVDSKLLQKAEHGRGS